MNKKIILHHLGLGDHIICNGLIREIIKDCDLLLFPVKHHNLLTVKRMFSDIDEKISYVPVSSDQEMLHTYYQSKNKIAKTIRLGIFFENNFIKNGEKFCESFYRHAGIDYEKRWDAFRFCVNSEKEEYIFENLFNNDFIFVHDDKHRGLDIRKDLLPNDTYVYRPLHKLAQESNTTIFDYIPLLEKAQEIHCMDSSFACMIDHLPSLRNKTKYIHRYVRNTISPIYKNNWSIIK